MKRADTMELLAPAGSIEVFETAVARGADAVYIGAPFFNARELAHHFRMDEIAAMIDFARSRKVRLYLAMNSLVKEGEIGLAVESLAMLEKLQPDGLIIQDLGLYYLLKRYFPKMRVHASTLMAAHNSVAVGQLAAMGFDRVVLPREMSVNEIATIAGNTSVELEVFIHGAMCFSYSGLCLFSSFQGGRSSLRGRCVQPCRRRYTWQGSGRGSRSGYLFSMNDLEGIDLLPDLARAGITSLKIEGRMRSASYVGNVVEAYRTVLDNPPGDEKARKTAAELLAAAMGRKTTRGYFDTATPDNLISHQHSGNIGTFLGKIGNVKGGRVTVKLVAPVSSGDRLRLHQENSGERQAFSLQKVFVNGRGVNRAAAGETISIDLPGQVSAGDSIYRVDVADRKKKGAAAGVRLDRARTKVKAINVSARIEKILDDLGTREKLPAALNRRGKSGGKGGSSPLWFKSDDPNILRQHFLFPPEKVVLLLSRGSYRKFFKMKHTGPLFKRLCWALPPVIDEADLAFYADAISRLTGNGYTDWQIGHIGQLPLFANDKKIRLSAAFTLNTLNSAAARTLSGMGVRTGIFSIETDFDNLRAFCSNRADFRVGMTVYASPPLFTSRFTGPSMEPGRRIKSPKGEDFIISNSWGYTQILPVQPFSLLENSAEVEKSGVDFTVIDLSGIRLTAKTVPDLYKPSGKQKGRKANTFNFLHTLS
ncbi:MAG: U32 family peptidase [Proteobacteria bacterium]|nr:U32 family peptidase [Pseudomonadota bacterium]MBU1738047.1 U32 family peptidase [Pseudomonadota bacterium]